MKQSNQELERQMEEFMRKAAAPVSNASYDMPGRITGPEVYRNQVPQVLPMDSCQGFLLGVGAFSENSKMTVQSDACKQ